MGRSTSWWTTFGGNPERTGQTQASGPRSKPSERWEFKGASLSPAVAGDTVYTCGTEDVYAIDARDGTQQWHQTITDGYTIATAPTVGDGQVYVGTSPSVSSSAGGLLYALDESSGRVQWTLEAITENGKFKSEPIVDNRIVYTSDDRGNIYAIDSRTGEGEWHTYSFGSKTGFAMRGEYIYSNRGGDVVAVHTDGRNGVTNFSDGYTDEEYERDPMWQSEEFEGLLKDITPAVSGSSVFVGTKDGTLYAFDARTGRTDWKFSVEGEIQSSPAVANGIVYVATRDRNVYAVDSSSGRQEWQFQTETKVGYSPLTVADGIVYLPGTDDGMRGPDGCLIALDATNGSEQWRYELDCRSQPVVSNGRIYIVSGEGIHALEEDTAESDQSSETVCPECDSGLDEYGSVSYCPKCGTKLDSDGGAGAKIRRR